MLMNQNVDNDATVNLQMGSPSTGSYTRRWVFDNIRYEKTSNGRRRQVNIKDISCSFFSLSLIAVYTETVLFHYKNYGKGFKNSKRFRS